MNIKDLQKPLPVENIDFRVQSINKGGYATILAYKDARIDMQRLDEVVGALNWKREHTRDNHNCIVSIYNSETKEWVSKEDTGTESREEKEKGLASDSFKRACFNWGIGRELYDYPVIQIKLNSNEFKIENYNGKEVVKPTFDFKLKLWSWETKFENDKLIFIQCKDEKGVVRFTYDTQTKPKVEEKPKMHQLTSDNIKSIITKGTQQEVLDQIGKKYMATTIQIKQLMDSIKNK